MISDDPNGVAAIEKAIKKPELVMVSDWSQFRSWEYMEAQEQSNLNLLYVIIPSNGTCISLIDTKPYSCVDSILVNGKGSVYCPGEEFLIEHTMSFIKWAIYPLQVTDKG